MGAKFNFRRRKCEVESYNRAKKIIGNLSFSSLTERIKNIIECYETKSELIEFFSNHPNLQVTKSNKSKDGKIYSLDVKVITRDTNGPYYIKQTQMVCQLVKENYVDEWRNIGNDYHTIHLTNIGFRLDYWTDSHNSFLLEQLKNQDKLEEMCEQLNFMRDNYFPI